MVKNTTIQVSEDTRHKLVKIKYDFCYKTMDEVILSLIKTCKEIKNE